MPTEKLEQIQQDNDHDKSDMVYIPPQRCLNTFFISGSDKELCLDMFQPAFDFMKTRGLSLDGNCFARIAHMYRRPSGEYTSIYQAWIPCKGEIEYCEPVELDNVTPSLFL